MAISQKEFNRIEQIFDLRIQPIKDDMLAIKRDISGNKQNISGLKDDVSGLKDDVSGLKDQMGLLITRNDQFLNIVQHHEQEWLIVLGQHKRIREVLLDKKIASEEELSIA
ncbi:MAG: hypothetical protein V1838_03560 [Patescibacteria group bacterium]